MFSSSIQFTKEIEENGKLPFLDCLVSRDNNELPTTVYRKPRIPTDYSTNHPTIRRSDLTQSHDYKDSDETEKRTLVTAYVTKTNTLNVFSEEQLQRWFY